tara:strand:- start:1601 stop:1900 length:300 start_codon:yes stop_codon:yes gene_type:complete
MEDLEFDFRDQIQATDWYPLEIHYKNNALFMVSTKLSLADVAKSVAQDEKTKIEQWINDGLVFRPPVEIVEEQRKDQYQVFANFIIVAPYVFIQSIKSE